MALKIRLSRAGAKKRPYYRIVLADSRSPRDGKYIERLGSYNPMLEKNSVDRVKLNEERIKYWLSEGAKPTDRIARFLGKANLIDTPQIPEQTKKSLPKQKTLDRIAERDEKAKAAAEAVAEVEQETSSKNDGPEQTESEDLKPETDNQTAKNNDENSEINESTADENNEQTEPEPNE